MVSHAPFLVSFCSFNSRNGLFITEHTSEASFDEVNWIYTDKDLTPLKQDLIQISNDSHLGCVNIKSHGQTFRVHRAVLVATSLVFRSMLSLGFQEMQSNEIDVTHWFGDIESAKGFFNYLYTGTIELNESNIIFMLQVSRMIFLEHLECHCEQYLLQKLTFDNVLSTTETALNYELKDLSKICFKYLKNIEKLLPYSHELLSLTRKQFKNFLSSDATKILKHAVVARMISHWNQTHYSEVIRTFPEGNTSVQMWKRENLPVKRKKTFKKKPTSLICCPIKTGSVRIQWTILIQESSGKTALFSPQNNSWGIFKLPAMKRSKLIGLFEDHILAYVDKNRVVCINITNNEHKISFINDKRNIRNRTSKVLPSRFFCFVNYLYSISPIQSYGFIIGWGIYRYSFRYNHWIVIFDIFIGDSKEFSVNIFDRTDYYEEQKITSMSYNVDPHNVTYSFVHNTQQSEYSTFTVISAHNSVENLIELPEVTFVHVKGKLIGFNPPLADVQLNHLDDGLKFKIAMAKRLAGKRDVNNMLAPGTVDLGFPVQKTKEITSTKYSDLDSTTAPFHCDLSSGDKIFVFNSKVYIALNSHPFHFNVFYCDFHTKGINSLPPLPTIFDEDFIILPAYLTKPISSIMQRAESYSALEACNPKWAISRWKGTFRQVND
ncbi:uncharacterized protein LOC115230632 isoform X1 [Octopus sinensis]|uniref:Uncharacterized protein LOC115230632 isoform X1 n=1 Tax=Octopus sinensis TaxID=2607531 RepID=A0A6P7U6M9_9MOLL|nr:uncharacterized protein LOC115230632 isoform X1 [Octopus sinensis]